MRERIWDAEMIDIETDEVLQTIQVSGHDRAAAEREASVEADYRGCRLGRIVPRAPER